MTKARRASCARRAVFGKCQDEFAVLTKNIKVRRGETEEEYHTEKVL